MKKVSGNFLILNLVISLFAFCFILNLGFVQGAGTPIPASNFGYGRIMNGQMSVKIPAVGNSPVIEGALTKTAAGGWKVGTTTVTGDQLATATLKEGTTVTGSTLEGAMGGQAVGFMGNLAQGLWWSMIAVGMIQLFGGLMTDDKNLINTLSLATFGGIMAGE